MTSKEAIKILQSQLHLDCKADLAIKELEARIVAIEALEKQIPKKPYIQQDDRSNDCMECPSCDSFIGYEYDCRDEHYQINYCPNCGQAIDWSEEE